MHDLDVLRKQISDFKKRVGTNEVRYVEVDICGLVKKMNSKYRKTLTISREIKQLDALIKKPPTENECFKLLSVGGGFSSIAIIKYIAELEVIEDLYVSTFRIGEKQFNCLMQLKQQGRLHNANFITSGMQKRTDKVAKYDGTNAEYNYFDFIIKKCEELNWSIKVFDNHSKLILMKTREGNYYVVETSSNLNENPKMEQFSFENDKALYDWYVELFKELMK